MLIDQNRRVTDETAFLISECCEALERFISEPELTKLESVIQTCDLTSSLVKRIEGIEALEDDETTRVSAPKIPFEKIKMLGEILRGERVRCAKCLGWRAVSDGNCTSTSKQFACN